MAHPRSASVSAREGQVRRCDPQVRERESISKGQPGPRGHSCEKAITASNIYVTLGPRQTVEE